METNERIQKVNMRYLSGNIFIPVLAVIVISVLGSALFGNAGAVLGTFGIVGAGFWWGVLGKKSMKLGKIKSWRNWIETDSHAIRPSTVMAARWLWI